MDIISDTDSLTAGLILGVPVEMKLVSDAAESGQIEGYASTFGGVDHGLDTIAPGAFRDSIHAHNAAKTAPAMLWAHRHSEPVGRWTAMGEDARGLRVRGALNLDSDRGRQAHAHVRAGDATGLSIGFQVEPSGMNKSANGGRSLTRLRLHEVSIVPAPMDPGARITSVKSIEIKSVGDLRALLRDAGLSRGAAEKVAGPGWAALSGDPDAPQPDPAAAELLRVLDRSSLDLKALQGLFK